MIEELSSVFAYNDVLTLPQSLNTKILQHITALKDEIERHFPELNRVESA